MNYDWKKLDLKNACIFDLTDDIAVIRVVLCDDEIKLKDKDIYKSDWSQMHIACDMHTFAYETGNSELIKELKKIFKAEFDENKAIFNE